MSKVQGRDRDVFFPDIVPYIHFSPVTDGEYTEVFALVFTTVENIPQLRTLVLRVPLTKFITMREKTLFSTCFFFITTGAADSRIYFVPFNCIEQGYCL